MATGILGPTGPQVQVPDEFPEFLDPADRAEYEAWLDRLDDERRRVDAEEFDAMYARQAMEAEHAAALEQDAGEGEPW
jgi:hypothetical protein